MADTVECWAYKTGKRLGRMNRYDRMTSLCSLSEQGVRFGVET